MAETVFNLDETKSALSRLVDRAARGEEIIIVKSGKPLARLVPLRQRVAQRKPGGWEARVHISKDFDEPLLPEILSAFEGQD